MFGQVLNHFLFHYFHRPIHRLFQNSLYKIIQKYVKTTFSFQVICEQLSIEYKAYWHLLPVNRTAIRCIAN